MTRETITIERLYKAPIADVWELWTTKEGIESWWGPGGFSVKVGKLDLRPGGEMHYSMTATGPEQVAFMKKEGMPLTSELHITFTEVVARRRLTYRHSANFIPGVAPYEITHVVELHQAADGVRMRLTIDAMHDEVWTQRATMGWESELGKLAKVLEARRAA